MSNKNSDAVIEQMVVRYEAQHALRCLYIGITVRDPLERYQREQNSLRTLRHELTTVARKFDFDPATGRYNHDKIRNLLGIPVTIDSRVPVGEVVFRNG